MTVTQQTAVQQQALSQLYESDETAWLETMAELLAEGRHAELDHKHLSEYLADMAKRDRREVFSRLVVLLSHLLKWQFQPVGRSGSWRATIREQRRELRQMLESKTLRNHAEAVFEDAYCEARKQAADEADSETALFPEACAWELDELLGDDMKLP
jgi:hypothetical protein